MPFPLQVPHSDGGGEIDAVGAGVDSSLVGRRVWVWNAAWRRPRGTAAQFVCLPARQAVPLPDSVDYEQAAGLGIPFMTAWHCLFRDGPIDGVPVLVAGGAGAVGNAAVTLAHARGAYVVTTVSSPEKAALARAAGADLTIDYREADAADTIRRAVPHGVQRVIELALGQNLALDMEVLADGGTIMVYAPEPNDPAIPTQQLMWRNLALRFMLVYSIDPVCQDAAVSGLTALLPELPRSPLPVRHYALDDVVAAHEAVENGFLGKVVVDLP